MAHLSALKMIRTFVFEPSCVLCLLEGLALINVGGTQRFNSHNCWASMLSILCADTPLISSSNPYCVSEDFIPDFLKSTSHPCFDIPSPRRVLIRNFELHQKHVKFSWINSLNSLRNGKIEPSLFFEATSCLCRKNQLLPTAHLLSQSL